MRESIVDGKNGVDGVVVVIVEVKSDEDGLELFVKGGSEKMEVELLLAFVALVKLSVA